MSLVPLVPQIGPICEDSCYAASTCNSAVVAIFSPKPPGVLQGAASSAVQPSAPSRLATSTWINASSHQGHREGADESDDSGMGGTGRLLRSHVAPAGTCPAPHAPSVPHYPAFQVTPDSPSIDAQLLTHAACMLPPSVLC